MAITPLQNRKEACQMAGVAGAQVGSCAEAIVIPAQAQCMRPEEWSLFILVNQDREKELLPKLELDCRLSIAARLHSQDMSDRGYFEHNSPGPNGTTPADRITAQVKRFLVVGENIAKASEEVSMQMIEAGFMASEGHRENILKPDYTHLGIGCVRAGSLLFCTQNFGGHPMPETLKDFPNAK